MASLYFLTVLFALNQILALSIRNNNYFFQMKYPKNIQMRIPSLATKRKNKTVQTSRKMNMIN